MIQALLGKMRRTLALILALMACSQTFSPGAGASPPWQNWQASLGLENPLTGRIWSASKKHFVSEEMLANTAADSHFILIGEIHDNADHHRLQAWLISEIADSRMPSVVMEMITENQAIKLAKYLSEPGADASGIGAALEWDATGWPAWPMYQPIAEAALEAGLPLVAGSPSRAQTQKISAGGLGALTDDERQMLSLDQDLQSALGDALLEEMDQSHCGLLPEIALPAMTEVQRYRDAVLANSLANADANGNGAILIAGNGHVRADRGVPWYLNRIADGSSVTVVMLMEVDEKISEPADYLIKSPDEAPAADFFWFTPRTEREDPCEMMRRQFGR